MSDSATIRLPQPCAENWDAMTPTGPGRHCAACQQVVVDFTAMTDGEVVAFLHRRPDVSCGWFRASQLDRVLVAAARPVAGWRRWLGTTAALLGLGSMAAPAAQGQSLLRSGSAGPIPDGPVDTSAATGVPATPAAARVAPVATTVTPATQDATPVVVRGRVCNWLGLPVSGSRVKLRSPFSSLGSTTTDAWGRFTFTIPAGCATEPLTLSARHQALIGRNEHYLSVSTLVADPSRPCRVVLERHRRVMGGKFRY